MIFQKNMKIKDCDLLVTDILAVRLGVAALRSRRLGVAIGLLCFFGSMLSHNKKIGSIYMLKGLDLKRFFISEIVLKKFATKCYQIALNIPMN